MTCSLVVPSTSPKAVNPWRLTVYGSLPAHQSPARRLRASSGSKSKSSRSLLSGWDVVIGDEANNLQETRSVATFIMVHLFCSPHHGAPRPSCHIRAYMYGVFKLSTRCHNFPSYSSAADDIGYSPEVPLTTLKLTK
eukprot:scaffold205541_cov23-Prasinocladus_malaysianus.AAC.1